MEYPVWKLMTLGGGFWIALISVIHVYIAHFAVGGGLFLVLTEMKARRENDPAMLAYVGKHTKFFLLLTMVGGGITGVGIWFSIALMSPLATITIIHNFVFGWATEWVFFLLEIFALLVYHYTFTTMEARKHVAVGWIYFFAGWMSLFLVNGILGFMLTPGDWATTGDFWDGFFNPTMLPQLVFRTAASLMIAGLFGFVTASRIADDDLRRRMVRYCAAWGAVPLVAVLLAGWWYVAALPPAQHLLVVEKSLRVGQYMRFFLWSGPLVALGALFLAAPQPDGIRRIMALVILLIGLAWFGAFEGTREAARKPFLIWDRVYSNSIPVAAVENADEKGLLAVSKWTRYKEITDDNRMAAGAELYQLQCATCHSVGGPMNDIRKRTAGMPMEGIDAALDGQGKINRYMPPFVGTREERRALAAYIAEKLDGRAESTTTASLPELKTDIPPFDEDADYLLTASARQGMSVFSDNHLMTIGTPGNTIRARLIRRGEVPEQVVDGVVLTFDSDSDAPEMHGEFRPAEDETSFEAAVAALPSAGGGFNPYPLLTVTAKDAASGKVLAQTKVVLPVSTELGCKKCHGGQWTDPAGAGVSDETARHVLAVHDRMNKTHLLSEADAGNPVVCGGCHADTENEQPGREGTPSLSAAIHGFHANYLTDRESDACNSCHANDPDGPTRFFRGHHAVNMGFECTACHGPIEDLAIGLLKGEEDKGVDVSALLANLKPRRVDSTEEIAPRKPWEQEPDCLTCHQDFGPGSAVTADGVWTKSASGLFANRKDEMDAVACVACHNSPHVVFPATNPYDPDRDNIQPLQYQGEARTLGGGACRVCHKTDMEGEAHHPNMIM